MGLWYHCVSTTSRLFVHLCQVRKALTIKQCVQLIYWAWPAMWDHTFWMCSLQPQPSRPVLDLPAPEGWKAELTWVVGCIQRQFTCRQTIIHPRTNGPGICHLCWSFDHCANHYTMPLLKTLVCCRNCDCVWHSFSLVCARADFRAARRNITWSTRQTITTTWNQCWQLPRPTLHREVNNICIPTSSFTASTFHSWTWPYL